MVILTAFLGGCPSVGKTAGGTYNPRSVLILVNRRDAPGTESSERNPSLHLGERYAALRGIPLSNILAVDTSWDEEISFADFERTIRAPVKSRIQELSLLSPIHYIVPIYGIPSRLRELPVQPESALPQRGFSLDQFLASMNSGNDRHWTENPYRTLSTAEHRVPFESFESPWKMYIVSRLDGPSAELVQGMMERAVSAEGTLKPDDGVGYFDWRNLGDNCGEYCDADREIKRIFHHCEGRGYRCKLNDQKQTNSLIKEARDTLWAWGWYSGGALGGDYRFIPGAVGAQLTSFTANSIRSQSPGAWVPHWIERGITATWGATAEPYTVGYASGEILLSRLWQGYNFGEAAYMATPNLNWMMVFIGDPLYRPVTFRINDRRAPEISSVKHVRYPHDPSRALLTFQTDEPGDTVIVWGEGNTIGDQRAVEPTLTREHTISIGPLRDGIRYTLQARSRDRFGNESISPNLTFGW